MIFKCFRESHQKCMSFGPFQRILKKLLPLVQRNIPTLSQMFVCPGHFFDGTGSTPSLKRLALLVVVQKNLLGLRCLLSTLQVFSCFFLGFSHRTPCSLLQYFQLSFGCSASPKQCVDFVIHFVVLWRFFPSFSSRVTRFPVTNYWNRCRQRSQW